MDIITYPCWILELFWGGILRENMANTIASDSLAPCVAESSEDMILKMTNRDVLVFVSCQFQR